MRTRRRPSPDAPPIGGLFTDARNALGLTQQQVADELGCGQSQISGFETGAAHVLSADRIRSYASLLKLNVDELGIPGVSVAAVAETVAACVDKFCPGNVPFRGHRGVLCVARFRRTSDEACNLCGGPMVRRCENKKCRAPLRPGVVCASCRRPIVTPPTPEELEALQMDQDEWLESHRELHRDLLRALQVEGAEVVS